MHIIDFHTHFIPLSYRAATLKNEGLFPDKYPTPAWDEKKHLEFMNQMGISYSLLSLSSPHVNFGNQVKANALARETNNVGAHLASLYPNRFGLLATLPLPDSEASLEEIHYCFDVLNVDGVTLPTNAQGIYLGEKKLEPIFKELNRRKAIVSLHPNEPDAIPEHVNQLLPIPLMEFFFDTSRTVINMILKGVIRKYPDIKFIIPHAGAVLPVLLERLTLATAVIEKVDPAKHLDIYEDFKTLYFDLAGKPVPTQLLNLLSIVPEDHLLYGSDYPYTPASLCEELLKDLKQTNLLTETQKKKIFSQNAFSILPNLENKLVL